MARTGSSTGFGAAGAGSCFFENFPHRLFRQVDFEAERHGLRHAARGHTYVY